MCYDNNKYIYVLQDETQQKLEREVDPYDIHDTDEAADSLLVYQYDLEGRKWKKLPNFWNHIYWKLTSTISVLMVTNSSFDAKVSKLCLE